MGSGSNGGRRELLRGGRGNFGWDVKIKNNKNKLMPPKKSLCCIKVILYFTTLTVFSRLYIS